jgi:hypothetical protein
MDIRFSCAACGHHMIIDEAGAGMVVACAECGRDVKVPKAVPRPPSPSADPNSQPEKTKTVAIKWTPPPTTPHVEPKK